MKKIRVNAWQVGLVFKDGAYKKMIGEGTYWFNSRNTVYVYSITEPFDAPTELNILLSDASLAAKLIVVSVRDNEIMLHYENALLKNVLTTGRYAFWKGPVKYDFVKADLSKIQITEPIDRNTLLGKHVAPFVRSVSVESHERALLFIDGEFSHELDSGIYYWWKNNIVIHVSRADMRQLQLEIHGQEILTKDKATLRVNAHARYRVSDIRKALLENKEYDRQLYVAFQLALREYLSGYALDEILDRKEDISKYVLNNVSAKAAELGVEVNDFGIKDIILPGEVKDIMNQVLIAEKKAQANSIMRREETASTRSLMNTAKLMEDNAMLWKLKEMEYVEKIAEKISTLTVSGSGKLIEQLKDIFAAR